MPFKEITGTGIHCTALTPVFYEKYFIFLTVEVSPALRQYDCNKASPRHRKNGTW
jgi:hypothetical protein